MPIKKEVKLIKEEVKNFSQILDGKHVIKNALELLVGNFEKYAINFKNCLYEELAKNFNKTPDQLEKNMRDALKKSKYSNYSVKKYLIETSSNILDKLEGKDE